MRKSTTRLEHLSVALWLATLFASLPIDESVAQAPFAPSNTWQDQCVRAVTHIADFSVGPTGLNSLEELAAWALDEFGSEEAAAKWMEYQIRQISIRAIELLRPAVDAGHLPSASYMLSYWKGDSDYPGLPSPIDRETMSAALFEAGFPLASRPIPTDAYDRGFFGKHELPPPPSVKRRLRADPRRSVQVDPLYTSHAEAAEFRSSYVEAHRWSAIRGNTSSWKALESAYRQIAEKWGGGVEYRIEQYAWLELTKRLWTMGDEHNVPAMRQADLAKNLQSEEDLTRASELAARYVRVMWPRRIELEKTGDICRLQPQFASNPDPYANVQSMIRTLEVPPPPADALPTDTRMKVTVPPQRHRYGSGVPIGASLYDSY
jgi:hypothetical protein